MKTLLYFVSLIILINTTLYSQGMIINEISNGISGSQEYYEFVVIGSAANPTAPVNLEGWIIDDNNGEFEGFSTTGIATGHVRIKPGYFTSVNPGSIIVIYNNAELLLIADPTDTNGDCVYIVPIDDESLDNNSTTPSTTSSSYIPSVYGALKTWTRIGLRNAGDVGQVRKPDGTFFHGFSYGDVLTPFPIFPSEFNSVQSFNVITGSGTARNYYFNCGSFVDVSNFSRGDAGINETPGMPNNDANRYFINAVRTGTYDYSNLANPLNCGSDLILSDCSSILSLDLISFNASIDNNISTISWEFNDTKTIDYFLLEYSINGYYYETVDSFYNSNLLYFVDKYSNTKDNYYRLKIIEYDNTITYSNVIYIENNLNHEVYVYPNPNKGIIYVTHKVDSIILYDELNNQVTNCNFIDNKLVINDNLNGIYYAKLFINNNVIVRKIIMN